MSVSASGSTKMGSINVPLGVGNGIQASVGEGTKGITTTVQGSFEGAAVRATFDGSSYSVMAGPGITTPLGTGMLGIGYDSTKGLIAGGNISLNGTPVSGTATVSSQDVNDGFQHQMSLVYGGYDPYQGYTPSPSIQNDLANGEMLYSKLTFPEQLTYNPTPISQQYNELPGPSGIPSIFDHPFRERI